VRVSKELARSVLPERRKNARKGDFGRVLIIGGSEDYAGAPALAAMGAAALRGGADLVTVAAPSRVSWAVNSIMPDIVTVKLAGRFLNKRHEKRLKELIRGADSFLIGPGIGLRRETRLLVESVSGMEKRKVIDADAIKLSRIQDSRMSVFTPHRRELEILLKNSGMQRESFQKNLGANVVLLKGPEDVVFSDKEKAEIRGGGPGMTAGGTGDVLSGVLAAMMAVCRGKGLFEIACAASWIMKRAGERAEKKFGQGMTASDTAEEVARVMKGLWK